jgi:propanediol dehydratase small subunit
MAESKINPDDISLYSLLIKIIVQQKKKDEEQGSMAEIFFLTGLVLAQRQPELVQEAKNYIKDTWGMTLDEIVDGAITMLTDAVEKYKENN